MTSLAKKPDIVRQVPAYIDPDQLKKDLERLKDKALSSGVADAVIIQGEDIVFDSNILKKVEEDNGYPSVHWPLDYPKDDLEEAISAYQWAIFFRINIDDNFADYV